MIVRQFRETDDLSPLLNGVYGPEAVEILLTHEAFERDRAWIAEEDGKAVGFACWPCGLSKRKCFETGERLETAVPFFCGNG